MKETIEIRRWDNDEVIFSYACENNTICKTIKEAINQDVSLAYADLSNYCFDSFDLSNINLSHAKLNNCFFDYAKLTNANLDGTDLTDSILDLCDITHKQLINAVGINDQCPKEGSFIGWKKCIDIRNKEYIVKLEIPADAKRSSATTNKCRCDKAKVLLIQHINGAVSRINEVYSWYDNHFAYKIGEMVYSDSFDDDFWVECSNGIHFFMKRKDAVDFSI